MCFSIGWRVSGFPKIVIFYSIEHGGIADQRLHKMQIHFWINWNRGQSTQKVHAQSIYFSKKTEKKLQVKSNDSSAEWKWHKHAIAGFATRRKVNVNHADKRINFVENGNILTIKKCFLLLNVATACGQTTKKLKLLMKLRLKHKRWFHYQFSLITSLNTNMPMVNSTTNKSI